MSSSRRDSFRTKWSNIEKRLEKDDYTNAFLSHFGFHDEQLHQFDLRNRDRITSKREW